LSSGGYQVLEDLFELFAVAIRVVVAGDFNAARSERGSNVR
jgi:endonuclease/exonuclease/phosphatase (EEP) superfamily protein YafD